MIILLFCHGISILIILINIIFTICHIESSVVPEKDASDSFPEKEQNTTEEKLDLSPETTKTKLLTSPHSEDSRLA